MQDDKYVVIKKEDCGKLWQMLGGVPSQEFMDTLVVHDATVIRGQDLFAAPALHTYANSIGVAIAILEDLTWDDDNDPTKGLQEVADYFHQRAVEAEEIGYKLPD